MMLEQPFTRITNSGVRCPVRPLGIRLVEAPTLFSILIPFLPSPLQNHPLDHQNVLN